MKDYEQVQSLGADDRDYFQNRIPTLNIKAP